MMNQIQNGIIFLQNNSAVYSLACLALLLVFAWLANWIVKVILIRGFYRIVHLVFDKKEASNKRVVARLANIVPTIIIMWGVDLIPHLPPKFILVVENVGHAFIVITVALAASAALDVFNLVWQQRPDAKIKPIKGYIQVVKIAIYIVAALFVIAALVDKSPLILLSGVGAMAAVLMLVFQDTLLSLVASVQINSNDLIRVGDWIEVPSLNANGIVTDIALHTVQVKNFDMTITNVPTKRLISDAFKNYRGMWNEGGRRINRSILLDQNSLHVLTNEERGRLEHYEALKSFFNREPLLLKDAADNTNPSEHFMNELEMTNLNAFRAYAEYYLRHHPRIRHDMHLMVRLMPSAEFGLPVEFYCFTATTVWAEYEKIQSDLIDHMLTVLPQFGLRVFQSPSGIDLIGLRMHSAS